MNLNNALPEITPRPWGKQDEVEATSLCNVWQQPCAEYSMPSTEQLDPSSIVHWDYQSEKPRATIYSSYIYIYIYLAQRIHKKLEEYCMGRENSGMFPSLQ